MRKILFIRAIVLTLAFGIFSTQVYAQQAAIDNGLNYLLSTQSTGGSWGEAPPQDQIIEDKIYRISADGTPTLFTTLLPEADPVSLKFSDPASAFGNFLYVSSNNRDNGNHGDCGGTIQRVDINGVVSDFTSLTSSFRCPSRVSTALGEPSGMAFGPGGAFGEDLYVANSAEPPSDIVRVNPLAEVIPFVDDGRFSRTRGFGLAPVDVTFVHLP